MRHFYLTFASIAVALATLPTNEICARNYVRSAALSEIQPETEEWKPIGKGTYTDGWVTPGIYAPADYLDPQAYAYEVDVMESTTTPGIYKIVSPYTSEAFPFIDRNANTNPQDIIIDATNPDFVRIEPQNSGFVNTTLTVNFTDPFFICNAGSYYALEGNSEEDIIAYGYASTLKDGVIDIIGPRFGKNETLNAQGYQWQGGYNGRLVLPEDTPQPPAGTWTSIGEATFVDGFIFTGWYGDPANHGWKVEMEELDGTPGMYRLLSPYTTPGNPMESANSNTTPANILVDATDPDIVIITPQFSGFKGLVKGQDKDFYIGNIAGSLIAEGNWTKETVKQYLPQRCDKMADGIITVKTPQFGFNAINDFGYQWTGTDDKPLEYPTRIYLPGYSGIKDINVSEETPVEYFNMQGLRVASPAPGNIYIRRHEGKTEKIFLR